MDEWTFAKFQETDPETQYHDLFSTSESLEDALRRRIDLKRKDYVYSRNNMISNEVAQANYLYSCARFRTFSPSLMTFLGSVHTTYSIQDDVYDFMVENGASSTLIGQYKSVIAHKADNKDFFEWSVVRNGILMPSPEDVSEWTTSRPSGQTATDFNGDSNTDFADFFLFADAYGGTDARFDLDGNGTVDIADFFKFVDAFGS